MLGLFVVFQHARYPHVCRNLRFPYMTEKVSLTIRYIALWCSVICHKACRLPCFFMMSIENAVNVTLL